MVSLNEYSEIDIPFEGPDLKCPACEDRIPVIVTVEVKKGTVRNVGSNGFRDPQYSVSVETKIRHFTIQHQCHPKEKE